MTRLNADNWPLDERDESGLIVWGLWAVLILSAVGVAAIGHYQVAGAMVLIATVLVGLAFAPCRWWRL